MPKACGECKNTRTTKGKKATTSSLHLSKDGHSILDGEGKILATFPDGLSISITPKTRGVEEYGHLVPVKKCVRWDSNHRCLEYVTSMQWVWYKK